MSPAAKRPGTLLSSARGVAVERRVRPAGAFIEEVRAGSSSMRGSNGPSNADSRWKTRSGTPFARTDVRENHREVAVLLGLHLDARDLAPAVEEPRGGSWALDG